jgi:seryl-tRNA synthetase
VIDPAVLRQEPERLRRSLQRRGIDLDVDQLVALDEELRATRRRAEEVRAAQRDVGKTIAGLSADQREEAIARGSALAEEYKELDREVSAVQARFDQMWSAVPNLVDDTAAEGTGEGEGEVIKQVGEPRQWAFEPADFATLGERLGLINMAAGAKVSGSRFGYLMGEAVLLEFALVRWCFERLVAEGFRPMVPPVLVRENALYGTGFFPSDRDQVYAVPSDDLFLVGTAEVPLAAYHSDEILEAESLPRRYAGFSTCFRREAGSYGKDTQGLFRVHQFDKMEMFVFTSADHSRAEHERLLALEESLVSELEVPYQVVNIAAGDLGSGAAKKYDIEAWFPSQMTYRELTSCSNTTDYQARRLKIRERTDKGTRLVHTLNGTAVAVGRTILAILENHQQEDGSVVMPKALRPHLGFDRIGP